MTSYCLKEEYSRRRDHPDCRAISLLPEIAGGFHVGIGAAGQMTTVYAVTYALLAPVIAAMKGGPVAYRYGMEVRAVAHA
jgi:hypothetical protein